MTLIQVKYVILLGKISPLVCTNYKKKYCDFLYCDVQSWPTFLKENILNIPRVILSAIIIHKVHSIFQNKRKFYVQNICTSRNKLSTVIEYK